MIVFDRDLVAQAVTTRAAEQKWTPDRSLVISAICDWFVTHPGSDIGYEDGRPNPGMRSMIDDVSHGTGHDEKDVLSAFGAAHCLLCDTVPGFRPALYSAWDRSVERAHG